MNAGMVKSTNLDLQNVEYKTAMNMCYDRMNVYESAYIFRPVLLCFLQFGIVCFNLLLSRLCGFF